MLIKRRYILFPLISLTLVTQNIFAAIAPAELLPGSVQPGLIGSQVPAPSNENKAAPALPTANKVQPQALPSEAEKIKFKLNRLVITGVTVYKAGQLEPLYKNYIGKNISLADLQTITDNITKRYREDGYLLSKAVIPAQKISNGVVTLQVIEGYISSVTIAGNPRGARHQLELYSQHLTQEIPVTIGTLERYVLLANDIPGLNVKTVLSPAKSTPSSPVTPGATQATLVADEHMASGYLGYDNRGTAYLGPLEYSFGGNVNSIFRSGDQTSIQGLVTTHTEQLQFYRLSHQTPLGGSGLQLNLAASYSKSQPGNVAPPGQPLGTLGIVGLSTAYSIGLSYPLIRTRADSLFLTTTFDTSNSTSNADALSLLLYDDRIRSLRVGATYSGADSWHGINQLGTQVSQGLPIFNNSPLNQTDSVGIPTLSRANGHSVYTKVNLDISRLQWIGTTNFSVLAAGTGQYAFNPLLVAEQFSFGGAQYGQAYDPAQFTGDHGLAGKLELRYDQDINWRVFDHLFNHIQYFGFYDLGNVWNVNANTLVGPTSGASAGGGVRTQFNKYLSGYAEMVSPLTAPAGAQLRKTPRIFFGITLAGDSPSSVSSAGTTPVAPTTQAYQPVSAQMPIAAAAE